ncbi:MAG: LysR family transcriptional regulator [Nakamurella sp.]
METRRLLYLRELARYGSMRQVADQLSVTTSTVSQQIASLAEELGVALTEPAGRRIRLTPAGLRLADHAVTILAAVDAARLDLDPAAEPTGTLRVAGFATAVRRSLLPIYARLAQRHPHMRMLIFEHEPAESLNLLHTNAVDLALVYDYNLAPVAFGEAVDATAMWSAPWSLGVPERGTAPETASTALFEAHRDADWIVNSRNTADETVVRTIASMAGFEPRITHHVDSLELVTDLIRAGLGIGLLPTGFRTGNGIALLPLAHPAVTLRAHAVNRRGHAAWAPLALVLDQVGHDSRRDDTPAFDRHPPESPAI